MEKRTDGSRDLIVQKCKRVYVLGTTKDTESERLENRRTVEILSDT